MKYVAMAFFLLTFALGAVMSTVDATSEARGKKEPVEDKSILRSCSYKFIQDVDEEEEPDSIDRLPKILEPGRGTFCFTINDILLFPGDLLYFELVSTEADLSNTIPIGSGKGDEIELGPDGKGEADLGFDYYFPGATVRYRERNGRLTFKARNVNIDQLPLGVNAIQGSQGGFFNYTLVVYVNGEQRRYKGVYKINNKANAKRETQRGKLFQKVMVAPNEPPTAEADIFGPVTNEAETTGLGNLIDNDFDLEDDDFEVVTGTVTSVLGATVTITGTDGTFDYDPTTSTILSLLAPGDSVADQFTYTLIQEDGKTSVGIVTVVVTAPEEE